ncbi:MAG: sulfite exporter TauE/SafE family protein [Sedimentisphaerales bacterium]|nr:sulfite exporter TauE/SafE family protein [Sedimentisphaerales bacterium]
MDGIWVFIAVGLIFSVAALVHGVCGFGFSLLAISALSFVLKNPKIIIPLDLIAATFNCIYLAWIMRKHILFKEVAPLTAVALVCIPLGALYLRHLDASLIMRSLGVVIILLATLSLMKSVHMKLFSSRCYRYIAGVAGGLLGGAFNIPGPPLVLYAYHCHWPTVNAKANLQFMFSVLTAATYISFAVAGLFTMKIVAWGLVYAPLVFAFTFAGSWLTHRVAAASLARMINVLLMAMGAAMVIKG